MAIRGVNLKEKEIVIHPDDTGNPEHPEYIAAVKANKKPDEPTKYYIGNLTADDRVEFGDMSATPTMRDGGITMDLRNTQKAYEVVRRGLKGWDNQQDSEGKPVAFKTGTGNDGGGKFTEVVSNECMQHLPNFVIMWLSNEIQQKNGMVAELAKKSDAQSQLLEDLNSVTGTATDVVTQNEPSVDA